MESGYVRAGQPFIPSARTWNGLVDLKKRLTGDNVSTGSGGSLKFQTVVYVSGGSAFAAGDAVGIGDAEIVPDTTQPLEWIDKQVYQATTPEKGKPWGILLAPVATGSIAPVCVCGVCLALVEESADVGEGEEQPDSIDVVDGKLTLSDSGPGRMIVRDSTTKLSLIVLANIGEVPPDGELEASESRSLNYKSGKIQAYNFDQDEQVSLGLQDCIEADPESGEITAINGGQYELIVRVKNNDGSVRSIGYMPLGESSGKDPEGTGESDDGCSHDSAPDGSGGGGGGAGGGDAGEQQHDGEHPGGGNGADDDHTSNEHPGKTGPCW